MKNVFVLFILLVSLNSFSQNDYNKLNSNGQKQGVWKGFYSDSKRLRYEGTFENGKEVGLFNFYDDTAPITANTIGNWSSTYLNEGFSVQDVYYFSKPFTKSFFKLDFYDTTDELTQQLYLSIILPIQQGLTQSVLLSPILPQVQIKKPTMVLDSIGADKEGFYIYWLRSKNFIDVSKFYMTAKFFNARLGIFKQMTNTRQDLITPNKFQFNNADYLYYRVDLNYPNKTYEVISTSTQLRVGDSISPIIWYEYVNP